MPTVSRRTQPMTTGNSVDQVTKETNSSQHTKHFSCQLLCLSVLFVFFFLLLTNLKRPKATMRCCQTWYSLFSARYFYCLKMIKNAQESLIAAHWHILLFLKMHRYSFWINTTHPMLAVADFTLRILKEAVGSQVSARDTWGNYWEYKHSWFSSIHVICWQRKCKIFPALPTSEVGENFLSMTVCDYECCGIREARDCLHACQNL